MSLMGLFPSERERQLAREEAWHAVKEHGDKAESVLLAKDQQTGSTERRMIYKIARKIVLTGAA